MPIKKPKKKRLRYRDNRKIDHSLDLLNPRTLLALGTYLTGKVTDEAHRSMEKLFRDYRKHKQEVHKSLLRAFKFLVTEQFMSFPDDPPYYRVPKGPPPSEATVKEAKQHINRIAKKVWTK